MSSITRQAEKSPTRFERGPQFEDLTLFTTTFYADDPTSNIRKNLFLNLLQNADALKLKCVVVDGGSSEEFLAHVRPFKNVTLVSRPSLGMGESRREALRIALGQDAAHSRHFFLWAEPEKQDLIKSESLTKILGPLRAEVSDIVVPRREEMTTMPHFQAWSEKRANKKAMHLTNAAKNEMWDLWFGPKAFNVVGANYFLNYNGKPDKWDAVILPVAQAHKDGKRVTSVPVNFNYTEEERLNEEHSPAFTRKRIEQYAEMLAAMGDPFWVKKIAALKKRNTP